MSGDRTGRSSAERVHLEATVYKFTPVIHQRAAHHSSRCNQSASLSVSEGNILHLDISENNIIITNPEENGGFTGMLIDLDLVKVLGSGRSGARHQTGTMEFMAIEFLLGIHHTYRHNLESFFYVLV